jgi:hypothetical protein
VTEDATARAAEDASEALALLSGNGDTVRNGTCVDRTGVLRAGVTVLAEEENDDGNEADVIGVMGLESEPARAAVAELALTLNICADGTNAGDSGRSGDGGDEDEDEDAPAARRGAETSADPAAEA